MKRRLLLRILLACLVGGLIHAACDRRLAESIRWEILSAGEAMGLTTARLSGFLVMQSGGPFLDEGLGASVANRVYVWGPSVVSVVGAGGVAFVILWLTGGPLATRWPFRVGATGATRCGQCGYPIAGLGPHATRCPECGRVLVRPSPSPKGASL